MGGKTLEEVKQYLEAKYPNQLAKEEVWDFFLSRFATIMDEVVESIVPEEKEVGHILECNMCSPKCGWNSAIATIKNNYKEIKQ